MRVDEVNIVVLLDSPEEAPATSCAAVSFSSPVCLFVARVPHMSRRAEGWSLAGPRRVWATLAFASRAAVSSGRPTSS